MSKFYQLRLTENVVIRYLDGRTYSFEIGQDDFNTLIKAISEKQTHIYFSNLSKYINIEGVFYVELTKD
jgi:hypothetical protein